MPLYVTPLHVTQRTLCARAGVVTKYYVHNSGEVLSSPLYSSWFREDIIADQRFERRRKQIPSQRKKGCVSEMEVESNYTVTDSRPLRGKRQVDCRICNSELTDWVDVTTSSTSPSCAKPPSSTTPPSSATPPACFHLFHRACYQYWISTYHSTSQSVPCPVCARDNKNRTVLETPPLTIVSHPVPLVLRDHNEYARVNVDNISAEETEVGAVGVNQGGITDLQEQDLVSESLIQQSGPDDLTQDIA